jgi:hypothetical protein
VNKQVRIRTIGPYLYQRRLRFKAHSPGAKLVVDQLRDFPVGEFDDGADALEQAIKMLIYLINGHAQRDAPQLLRA